MGTIYSQERPSRNSVIMRRFSNEALERPPEELTKAGVGHGTYGYDEHVVRYGTGQNRLRTARVAQPRALHIGDRLATGDVVLSIPQEDGYGGVLLRLTGGPHGQWVVVPARIPIALLTKEDGAPEAVWKRGSKS